MLLNSVRSIILFWALLTLHDLYVLHTVKRHMMANRQLTSIKTWIKPMVYSVFLVLLILLKPLVGFAFVLLSPLALKIIKKNAIRQNQRVIEFYGYKIFKFIINQISSGILVSDALQSMFLIVRDLKLKNCLIEVSAYYAHTTDLNSALMILKDSYTGVEVDTLCVAIEQGIQTGGNFETLIKMEELLFKKYIFQIKHDTELRKKRGILAVLLLCMVIVLMVAIPIAMDILEAFDQIFY